jgi:hypothetical protein
MPYGLFTGNFLVKKTTLAFFTQRFLMEPCGFHENKRKKGGEAERAIS